MEIGRTAPLFYLVVLLDCPPNLPGRCAQCCESWLNHSIHNSDGILLCHEVVDRGNCYEGVDYHPDQHCTHVPELGNEMELPLLRY